MKIVSAVDLIVKVFKATEKFNSEIGDYNFFKCVRLWNVNVHVKIKHELLIGK